MNTNLTFHRSGTGPAGRRAGRVPSLPVRAIHTPRQPAIPDEGRSAKNYPFLNVNTANWTGPVAGATKHQKSLLAAPPRH